VATLATVRTAGKLQLGTQKLRSWKVLAALIPLSSILITVGVLTWALKDVPWQEIADGSLKPVIALETSDGGPLVRQGPYQELYASYEQFPRTSSTPCFQSRTAGSWITTALI
jgi:hypothetical protein